MCPDVEEVLERKVEMYTICPILQVYILVKCSRGHSPSLNTKLFLFSKSTQMTLVYSYRLHSLKIKWNRGYIHGKDLVLNGCTKYLGILESCRRNVNICYHVKIILEV